MYLKSFVTFTIAASAACIAASAAIAQDWPRQTVRIVTNFPAGTGGDVAARVFGESLSKRWNKPVIVENRAGADGVIAVSALMNANDGHTLLFANGGPFTSNPLDPEKHLPYDSVRDVVPISSAVDVTVALATPASIKVRTLAEFVALAKSQPGALNWSGTPGALDFIVPNFFRNAGIDLKQVSYRDIAPAMQDLSQSRLHLYVSAIATLLPIVQTNSAHLIATTNSARTLLAPQAPTAAEAGFADLDYNAFLGFFGPRNMQPELRDRVSADIRATVAERDIDTRFASYGMIARASTSAEFSKAIDSERTRLAEIAGKITPRSAR